MSFWGVLSELPDWFQMGFLSFILIGLFFIGNELANRKMKISKEGVTFDRLREKKSLLIQLLQMRQKKKDKVDIRDV
jgi:hypothetical protein